MHHSKWHARNDAMGSDSATQVTGCRDRYTFNTGLECGQSWRPFRVESRCGAVAVGRTYLLPPLSSGGALVVQP